MQQHQRFCTIPNHNQSVIEHACVYSDCKQSRFLCSNCIVAGLHSHNQLENKHILDQTRIGEKLISYIQQKRLKEINYVDSVIHLRQIIQDIQNKIYNMNKIIQQIEQGMILQDVNMYLENQLQSIQKYGFNRINDQEIARLINLNSQFMLDIYQQLKIQSESIIQNAQGISEWKLSDLNKSQIQMIKEAKYQIIEIDEICNKQYSIFSGAISNDLKYIIAGFPDCQLRIWDYDNLENTKSIQLKNSIHSCRFTDDSALLFVGSQRLLYQFDVNNQFNQTLKYKIHDDYVNNIFCISSRIILTSSDDKSIIKTDIHKRQQLFRIQAHDNYIGGLDFNHKLNQIVSSSFDKSIKLWDGFDGTLIILKQNAHNERIIQVLFIANKNQLISLGIESNIIIWDIDYQTKLLLQQQTIQRQAFYISLVIDQFIVITGNKYIELYSISGQFIRQIDHDVDEFWCMNTIQPNTLNAVLIKGQKKLRVCKIELK